MTLTWFVKKLFRCGAVLGHILRGAVAFLVLAHQPISVEDPSGRWPRSPDTQFDILAAAMRQPSDFHPIFSLGRRLHGLAASVFLMALASVVSACPFCSALPRTISDDLEEASAAVIARCISATRLPDDTWNCRMTVVEVVKGESSLVGRTIDVLSLQEVRNGQMLWALGFGEEKHQWSETKGVTPSSLSYFRDLGRLGAQGQRPLSYFLAHLKSTDETVASDAYNEFAEATLKDISRLKYQIDRGWVLAVLRDKDVPVHQRRLCWTLLSQCGTKVDLDQFDEAMQLRALDPAFEPGMDAAISCYLSLGGAEALDRIERDFLAGPEVDESDAFAAIHAIRIHGTELGVIPRTRLARSFHVVLQNPRLADLVIPDLARWQDWSAIDQVTRLFESSNAETRLNRPAAVLYLKSCPRPEAKLALDRLRKIDPVAVQVAESSMLFTPGNASIPVPPPDLTEEIGK